jgi:multimeric flavodoxin WrbA
LSNILGISGSPVQGSSTEILVREILRGAESRGAKADFISLNELDIMPCQACGQSPEEGFCFFNDGMEEIYERFERCDSIVVGSPIYFDSVSAQTKLFIDRTNCFRTLNIEGPEHFTPRITKHRKGAMVLVGGEREKYEYARRVIGGFFIWAGIESIEVIYYGHGNWGKGSVIKEIEIMGRAFKIGIKLADV